MPLARAREWRCRFSHDMNRLSSRRTSEYLAWVRFVRGVGLMIGFRFLCRGTGFKVLGDGFDFMSGYSLHSNLDS